MSRSQDIGGRRVPPELCDSIIGHLQDDTAALQRSSLVCRDWLPASTLHLFRHLQWPPCSRPGKSSCQESWDRSKIAAELENALRGSPRLRGAVQDLTFTVHSHACGGDSDVDPRVSHNSTPLFCAIALLPHIRKLSVVRFPLQAESPPEGFLQVFSLEDLSIDNCSLSLSMSFDRQPPAVNFNQLIAFIACFKSVSRLTVRGRFRGARDMANLPVAPVIQPRLLRVTSLSVSVPYGIMDALSFALDFESIQSFRVYSVPYPQTALKFTSQMPNLQSLEYPPCDNWDIYPNYRPFAGCPPLRSLKFKSSLVIYTGPGGVECLSSWPFILSDLHRLDLCELQELAITHIAGERASEEGVSEERTVAQVIQAFRGLEVYWEELETILHRRAPKLQRLEIQLLARPPPNPPLIRPLYIFGLFEKIAREMLSPRMNELVNIVIR